MFASVLCMLGISCVCILVYISFSTYYTSRLVRRGNKDRVSSTFHMYDNVNHDRAKNPLSLGFFFYVIIRYAILTRKEYIK